MLSTAGLAWQEPAAETKDTVFQFQSMPPTWVVVLVVVPLVIAFAWWSYGGLSRIEPHNRAILSVLRGAAILLLLFAIAQPILETRTYTQIRSQIHFLVDDSASMQRKDTYPDAEQKRSRCGEAARASRNSPSVTPRGAGREGAREARTA